MTVTDSDEATDSAASNTGRTHSASYEAGTERPSVALIEAVAAAKDEDPVALDPIGSHFDMDALDALLESSHGEQVVAVTVQLNGVRVEIDSEGTVAVRRTGTEAPGGDT